VDLKNAKIMSGIGVVLSMTGHFGIIGVILLLIGVYRISEIIKDKRIFNYILWPEIIGYVLLASVILGKGILISQSVTGYSFSFGISGFSAYLLLLGIIAIMIIPIIYEIKAYTLLGDYFGNDYFYKSAKFLKWGLILSVILVGFLLIFLADIFKIIGYFTLPDEYRVIREEEWRVKNL
jgi:uncharacterized membrane protein